MTCSEAPEVLLPEARRCDRSGRDVAGPSPVVPVIPLLTVDESYNGQ